MNIKEKLEALRAYYETTRQVGHSTLMMKGTDTYEREKLILDYKKSHFEYRNCKPAEIISWHRLEALKGNNKPLAIDNGVMWVILNETLNYIEELESKNYSLRKVNEKIEKIKEII